MEAPQAAPVAAQGQVSKMNINEAVLVGRVDVVRRFEGQLYTRMILPAPDSYSRPETVEIQSKESVGEVGQDARVRVRVGGFKNDFEAQGVKVKSARVLLRAVE